jgi:hypothetical protein
MTHIIIALDENYFHKAEEHGLFDSLYQNKIYCQHVKLLCFDFSPPKDHRFESATVKKENLISYREGFPKNQKNRTNYVCAEGGEFLEHFKLDDKDHIIHIDADMILQRPFTKEELNTINNLKHGEVGASYTSEPTMTLLDEAPRLNPIKPTLELLNVFPHPPFEPLFCAGLIACTVKTYREVIFRHYQNNLDKAMSCFDHHAAGQWLMNYIVYKHAKFVDLGRTFHHGDWFIGSDKQEKDNKLLYKGEVVLFNHHKFNKVWSHNQ